MELFYCLSLLPTFLFILFMLSKIGQKPKTQIPDNSKLPPGPKKLPIIGNIHHLLHPLPHHALWDLAKIYGPHLMHLKLGLVSFVVVSSPEAAREIMKDHDTTFATRPEIFATKVLTYGGRDIIFSPYGEYWRQLRKLCTLELFSAKRVQSFRSIREEEVFNLVRYIFSMNSLEFNLSERFSSLASSIATRAAFGSKCLDQKQGYLKALKEAVKLASGFHVADLYPGLALVRWVSGLSYRVERCRKELDRTVDGIIEDFRERRRMGEMKGGNGETTVEENLLDVLLRTQEQEQEQEQGGVGVSLTTNEIKAVITDVFAAGTGTLISTMSWAMSELIKNPRVMKKAQVEVREVGSGKPWLTEEETHRLNYLKLVIKETLRLHPPAPLLVPRECTATCRILGYEIPAKTRVIVNAWGMGRDPQYWDDPEAFKPERFVGKPIDFKGADFEFIPFGAGRRICPGMLFGLANMELAIAQLLYYFDWKLPNGLKPDDLDMTESFGAGVRKKFDLYLCAIPHIPLPSRTS